ncbi:MAG TPA: TonB-dependent receptor [Gemmatimonadaceae bacterium]|nr:TonB-dependent receptor [Gemmatimonadaceae bacterium]
MAPLAAVLLSATATTSRAQGRDSVATLPAVEVVGSVLAPVVSAAGSGVPARSAVLGADELRVWQPRHLGEALAAQPGVSLYDDLGSPYKTTLVTRGFTASPVVGLPQGVSVLLDGVPVNEPDAGQVNFDLLPLAHVRRVEVLSGTASLLGPYSLGGAVNLVTRRGEGSDWGEIEVAGGSRERYAAQAAAAGEARGWQYFAGGGYEREAGWRQLTSARLGSALLNVGRFGPSAGLGLQAFAATSYAETAGSLPASTYAVRPDSNLSAGDFEDLRQLHLAVTGYRTFGGGRGSFTLYHRRHRAERFNVNQVNDPDVRGFADNRTVGALADWRTVRAAGPGALGLRVGGGGSASRSGIRILAERLDPGLTTDVASPIRKLDAYALADYRLGVATLSGGVRYDVVRVPFRNRLDPSRDTTSTFRRLSPRAGVSVAVARGASLYLSAGQSFRAPAVIELACADPEEPCPLPFALGDDPPLAPVVATTYEAGGRWARGGLLLSASAYRTDVRDDIFLFPYGDEDEPAGSTIDGYFGNVRRTRRAGVELAANVTLPGAHALYASYALTRATFRTGDVEIFSIREAEGGENVVEPGDRLPLVPDRTLVLGGTVMLPAAVRLGAEGRYTGRRWLRGDEANETAPLPGVWVADLRLGREFGAWAVEGIVRNLLDRRYATFGTFNLNQGAGDALERFLTPAQPRSVQLVLRRRLGADG